jgi:hypothetical protein
MELDARSTIAHRNDGAGKHRQQIYACAMPAHARHGAAKPFILKDATIAGRPGKWSGPFLPFIQQFVAYLRVIDITSRKTALYRPRAYPGPDYC